MPTYIHYSEATDVTGPILQERLGIRGGVEMPNTGNRARIRTYIGWGCKTREDTNIPNRITVLNHPDMVRRNRNKLTALEVLRAAEVPVADFLQMQRRRRGERVTNLDAMQELGYPLIGRLKFHQGGKGFWTILNRPMLEQAAAENCGYVQRVIATKTEYRVHVFDGRAIYVVKKVPQNNPQAAWIATMQEKIAARAAGERGVNLDEATVNFVLNYFGPENAKPNMIIKSNTRGWKFSRVALNRASADLRQTAVNAINALGLSFGAVDMAVDIEDNMFVIEVNSAPGLERTTLDTWVEAFQAKLQEIEQARQAAEAPPARRQAAAAAAAPAENLGGNREWVQNLARDMNEEEATGLRALLERMGG